MMYLIACLLLVGAILGVFVNIKVIAAVMSFWLLLVLPLSLFLSANSILNWIIAAVVLQCGYFLGMLIRTALEATGHTIFGLSRAVAASRSEDQSSKKDRS